MSEVILMQKLLDRTLEKIQDLQEKIKITTDDFVELKLLKKQIQAQIRIKITLIQSIQELRPSESTVTIYTPLKKSLFSRIKGLFGFNTN
jgi:hypothetical protein